MIVIIVGKLHLREQHPAADVWIAFGTGRNFKYLHINAKCSGKRKGHSTTHFSLSYWLCYNFYLFGKAWDAWKTFPEVTKVFLYMASDLQVPLNIKSEECFCVIIYDKTSILENVKEARRELFCQKNRTMETIPPSQDAFLQHCRRAAYQAGIWSTSDRAHQELPSPEGYGWTLNTERKWSPVSTTLP